MEEKQHSMQASPTSHQKISLEREEPSVLSPLSDAQLLLQSALAHAEFARSESVRLRTEFELERSFEKNAGKNISEFGVHQETEFTQLQLTCKNQATEIQILKEIETIFRDRCRVQAEQLNRLEQELKESKLQTETSQMRCSRLEKTVREQEEQLSMLRELLTSQESRNAIEEKTLEKKSIQLERQEEQLRVYATSLSTTRNSVKEFSKELVQDIQATRSIHPLKDYLSLTEFELAKVELQLKKTPTASTERPKLESCLEQLLEQRNFLRSTIETSQKENEQRAALIHKIADGQKLPYVPPPPPNVTRVERARTQGLEET